MCCTMGIVIPLSDLPQITYTGLFVGAVPGPAKGVGVYASVSRQRITLRNTSGPDTASSPIQVNREANPLFNEALVALKDKDQLQP